MPLTKTLKRRNKKKRKVIWWLLGIIIVTVVGGYIFWRQQNANKVAAQENGPETLTVSPSSYNVTVSGPGTLKPIRNLDTVAKVRGTIIRISQVGDQVSKGDILVQIDPVPFERAVVDAELALEKAKVQRAGLASSQANNSSSIGENIANAQINLQDANRQVETARADLELTQRLFEIGSESAESVRQAQDTLDKALENQTSNNLNLSTLHQSQIFTNSSNSQDLRGADLAVEQAKLNLETTRDDLANTQIIAPFDGVVASVIGQVGGNSEGASSENQEGVATGGLLGLIDDSKLVLEAQVDETAIVQVQLDQEVEVTVDALADRIFNGKVTAMAPIARVVSNIPIYDVTIVLDNSERVLRAGMTAEADIIISKVASSITVPNRAIQIVEEEDYIKVQTPEGDFALQPVKVIDSIGFSTVVEVELSPDSVLLLPEVDAEEFLNF